VKLWLLADRVVELGSPTRVRDRQSIRSSFAFSPTFRR